MTKTEVKFFTLTEKKKKNLFFFPFIPKMAIFNTFDEIYSVFTSNKGANMALNHSPEFKSSNPKPSLAEHYGILGPSFEQT